MDAKSCGWRFHKDLMLLAQYGIASHKIVIKYNGNMLNCQW